MWLSPNAYDKLRMDAADAADSRMHSEHMIAAAERKIKETETLQGQCREVLAKADARQYTTLASFAQDNADYLLALHKIVTTPEFLYFMHVHTMSMAAQIADGGDEKAKYAAGIIRGLDLVMKDLHAASRAYRELLESKEQPQGDLGDAEV